MYSQGCEGSSPFIRTNLKIKQLFGLPGDQDDGHCRKSSRHSLGKSPTVAVWHVDVADDQSHLVSRFLDDPKTVGTISSLDGLEILPLQNGADEPPNSRLVINHKRDASHAVLDDAFPREGFQNSTNIFL